MMTPKNIMIIVPDLNVGGVGRVVSNLSLYLSKHYNLTLCVFDLQNCFYPLPTNFVDLKTPYRSNPLLFFKDQLVRIRRIRKLKATLNIDVSISFMSSAHYVNCLSKKNETVILSLRNPFDSDYLHRNFRRHLSNQSIPSFIKSKTFKKADFIVPNSLRGLRDLKSNIYLKKSKIRFDFIQNYVDIGWIGERASEPLEEGYSELFKCKVLLNVGRLYEQKATDKLLLIFKELRVKNLKLVIIGDGHLRENLLNLSKDLHLRTYSIWSGEMISLNYDVYFLGAQQNPYKFMKNSSLFVLPTLYEGFPNTVIESMACGLPVLVSDCVSGPREILLPESDINSYAFQPEYGDGGVLLPKITKGDDRTNINLWAEIICKLLQEEAIRIEISKEAVERVQSFSKETILKKWENLIERT